MYRLVDTCFAHHPTTCSPGDVSHQSQNSPFWNRSHGSQPLVITHGTQSSQPFISWLLEPWVLVPQIYDQLLKQPPKQLQELWSHNWDYLAIFKRRHPQISTLWVPNAMTFIQPSQRSWGKPLYQRRQKPCAIFSNKLFTPAHQLRNQVFCQFKSKIDFFGTCTGKRLGDKSSVLTKYAFSVVMENNISSGYFSEKIIDCFFTGCIPLYYGSHTTITKLFDTRGILFWQTLDELQHLLKTINISAPMEDARKQNFYRAQHYCSVECWFKNRHPAMKYS